MIAEGDIVLRDDEMEPLFWLFNLDELKDLHVVLVDLI